jgi:hypothetical protein
VYLGVCPTGIFKPTRSRGRGRRNGKVEAVVGDSDDQLRRGDRGIEGRTRVKTVEK